MLQRIELAVNISAHPIRYWRIIDSDFTKIIPLKRQHNQNDPMLAIIRCYQATDPQESIELVVNNLLLYALQLDWKMREILDFNEWVERQAPEFNFDYLYEQSLINGMNKIGLLT